MNSLVTAAIAAALVVVPLAWAAYSFVRFRSDQRALIHRDDLEGER